jgi:DNA invertase Pin-like site-specific DNA recombinase/DNA-binding CsgD family transcriptional regulator
MSARATATRKTPRQVVLPGPCGIVYLTARQTEVLQLAVRGLSSKQIARHLGISARTVEDHLSAMRQRTGAHNQSELAAYGVAAGLVKLEPADPEAVTSWTGAMPPREDSETRPASQSRNSYPPVQFRDRIRDARLVSIPPAFKNSVRIGYARLTPWVPDDRAQLDALASAQCHEVLSDTARCVDARPALYCALEMLRRGDTLVIYELDRLALSIKEVMVLLEDQLQARGINLHILSGVCAGLHRPEGATIAEKMLFMVAATMAKMERDQIRERMHDGLHAARVQGRCGRPAIVNDDILAITRTRLERGESVTYIARDLGIGRSTLYRALDLQHNSTASRLHGTGASNAWGS